MIPPSSTCESLSNELSEPIASSMFLSTIFKVCDSTDIVLPSTVRSPLILALPFTSKVATGPVLKIPILDSLESICIAVSKPVDFLVLIKMSLLETLFCMTDCCESIKTCILFSGPTIIPELLIVVIEPFDTASASVGIN